MKGKKMCKRILSLVMVFAMLVAYAVPTHAASVTNVRIEKADDVGSLVSKKDPVSNEEGTPRYDSKDIVRVSIILDEKSTIDQGYATKDIALNSSAMRYRTELKVKQDQMTRKISAVTGQDLDVVWNLTLAANLISANVEYGQIKAIQALPGVKSVVLETRYQPNELLASNKPNMAISNGMTGSGAAWQAGYTGAGSRIAIIDTGLDTAHQSFNNDAFMYALEQDAAKAEMALDAYLAKQDLLDADEIGGVLSQLNAAKRMTGLSAAALYRTNKIAYGFNYVDGDLDITHMNDTAGEHGSHVAGIASANRYLVGGDGFVNALDAVRVTGNAPDAQLMVMKVFGKNGGAYDSDYMAAIEDAIVLGADSVNLSLGSPYAGFATSSEYQNILDKLAKTDTVVVISAGNNYAFGQFSSVRNQYDGVEGYLYNDDVNFHTGGSPGTYANALTVASVDNQGRYDHYFAVAGSKYLYSESTDYSNAPLRSLAPDGDVELDYVLIDGSGLAEDYTGIDVTDKVVFCRRGGSSFFEKGNVAAGLGAKAVLIYNNVPGVINLNLTGYEHTAPVVSILMGDGEAIKAASTQQTTADGNVYYTGKITIAGANNADAVSQPSPYYIMSTFSGWGVPGNLTLKPEITAPGGDIYSVAGSTQTSGGTDQYELMSGTSMAAPQVTGMMALLMQYIRENKLSQPGITDRALAQSLLMSTAMPMVGQDTNGLWIYPVIQQGAGLANAANAMGAASYVLVNGNTDGKVKAELGDDPGRTGVYSFSFTLNNLTAQTQTYTLDADVFTQGWLLDAANNICLDRNTVVFNADMSYVVNGQQILPAFVAASFDFDGDGDVDKADAQLLMDHLIQGAALIANQENTDVDEDGDTDTHDVYALLALLDTICVDVPADGSVQVDVTIGLPADVKAVLNANSPNGAYVEAYVYANAVANEEGAVTASHSIPVLGFYGNWSDASMFDKGTRSQFKYGTETRMPYFYEQNNLNGNALTMNIAGDGEYYYSGNLYGTDDAYLAERNALNNLNGNTLETLQYALIRNAGAGKITITDTVTGTVYYELALGDNENNWVELVAGFLQSTNSNAYNHSNTMQQIGLGWAGTDASGNPLPEGTTVEVKITMAPEYYVSKDGSVDWNALGKGASMSTLMTIDNTAPVVVGDVNADIAKYDSGVLSMTVHDNRHIALAGLYALDGTPITEVLPNQTTADTDYVLNLDAPLADGVYLLDLVDYACNESIYRVFVNCEVTTTVESVTVSPANLEMVKGTTAQVSASVEPLTLSDRSVTWSSSNEAIATVDENGVVTAVSEGSCTITATSVLDSTVSGSCELSVISINYTLDGALQDVQGNPMTFTWNMETDALWSKVAGFDNSVGSLALSATGAYYMMDADSNTYAINPATGELLAAGQPAAIPYWDMTASIFGTSTKEFVHGVYGPYLFPVEDPFAPDAYGYNLTEWLSGVSGATYLIGIASGGYVNDATYGDAEALWALDNAGCVWLFEYVPAEGTLLRKNCIPTTLPELPTMGEGDYIQCSLVQADDGNLFYSYYNGETNVIYLLELYSVSDQLVFKATEAGNVGQDVWPALLASATANVVANPAYNAIAAEDAGAEMLMQTAADKVQVTERISLGNADAPAGSTNALSDAAKPESSGEMTPSELVVQVTAQNGVGEVDATNGKVTVGYDTKGLTLVSVLSNAEIHSFVDQNGVVTIGYADLEAFAAGDSVATLIFTVADNAASDVTVTNLEVNNEHVNASETLTHTFTDVVTPPTCTEKGYTTHTCTDPNCGYSYVDSYVDALGHDYVAVITPPTATEKGYTTHTCSRCGDSYVDTYTDAIGYQYIDNTADQKISTGSDLEVHLNTPAGNFTGVYVNGVVVDAKYYTMMGTSDRTVVILSKEYLINLAEGVYTLTVEVTSETATVYKVETTFTIHNGSGNVHTGDTFRAPLWIGLLVLSACGVAVLTVGRKKFRF